MELLSQFRCNGSDGYLAWIDHVLGIRETAHVDLSTLDYDYDFQVLDSPNEIRRIIEEKNAETGRARMVAGYCWDCSSKRDPAAWDVVLPEHDFRMRWNLTQHGSGWLAHPDSISEIGCIHTCQGPGARLRGRRDRRGPGSAGWRAGDAAGEAVEARPVDSGLQDLAAAGAGGGGRGGADDRPEYVSDVDDAWLEGVLCLRCG
jgi:hypothetical protein